MLWGEEALAQDDKADPDIKITRWNNIPNQQK